MVCFKHNDYTDQYLCFAVSCQNVLCEECELSASLAESVTVNAGSHVGGKRVLACGAKPPSMNASTSPSSEKHQSPEILEENQLFPFREEQRVFLVTTFLQFGYTSRGRPAGTSCFVGISYACGVSLL